MVEEGRRNDGGEIVGIMHTMLTRNNALFQCIYTYIPEVCINETDSVSLVRTWICTYIHTVGS